MKKYIIIILFFAFISAGTLFPQEKNDTTYTGTSSVYLRSIHLDLTTVFFQNDISLSSDINLFSPGEFSIGLQPGISFLTVGGLYNTVLEEPFIDYNLAGYFSTDNKSAASLELLLGYVYRTSTKKLTKEYPLGLLKYGITVNWNTSKYLKLFLKFSQVKGKPSYKGSAAGVGISLGYWD